MKHLLLISGIVAVSILSCRNRPGGGSTVADEPLADSAAIRRNLEAREDSLEMVQAFERQARITNRVVADLETEPVGSDPEEDAADDPAIWYNREQPGSSLILGTDKNYGVYSYDLKGRSVLFRAVGEINNIDLRDRFAMDGMETVLVAGSNRSNNSITLMTIQMDSGYLSDSLYNIPSGVDEVYGICCYQPEPGPTIQVFVNGKGGLLEHWMITYSKGFRAELLRTIRLGSQPEGMVADDSEGILYVGVEQEGIYRFDARPTGDSVPELIPGSTSSNPHISYDIEGLALLPHGEHKYLVASSQGSYSYAVFRVSGEPGYITSFAIDDGNVDSVEETDGLEITIHPLNDHFKSGMLVVQDGFNTDNGIAVSQNFKCISLERILPLLKGN